MNEPYFSDRRRFIRQSGLGLIGVTLLPSFMWEEKDFFVEDEEDLFNLVILHTNDMHSHIEPFPANDSKYPAMGGMARRADLIKRIRAENEHVLLLDAGDIFQGTPYFNFFGGEVEFKMMSEMRYDAATMGNHDFDNGLEGFEKMLPHAQFPFICSNYDFSETLLHQRTLKNLVLERGPIKIGIFGLGVELDGLVMKKNYGNTRYLDPIKIAEQQVKILREEKHCDLIICLSHLGYSYKTDKISDLKLAKATTGIDLILGGHTHTFLDEAVAEKNREGKTVYINQVGWAGLRLGKINVSFKIPNKSKNKKDISYIVEGRNSDIC